MSLYSSQNNFLNLILPSVRSTQDNAYKNNFPKKGLNIYSNNIKQALKGTLQEIYPVCEAIVGQAYFRQLCFSYIKSNPSKYFSLHEYGDSFADFIVTVESCNHLKYLPDVAKLEYCIFKSLLGKDAKVFNQQDFANLEQSKFGDIIFKLLENSCLLESSYPVDKIWKFNQGNITQESIDPRVNTHNTININLEKTYLFIFSRQSDIYINRVTPQEFLFLQYLQKSLKFEEVCDSLMTSMSLDGIVSTLSNFISLGYIDSYKL